MPGKRAEVEKKNQKEIDNLEWALKNSILTLAVRAHHRIGIL